MCFCTNEYPTLTDATTVIPAILYSIGKLAKAIPAVAKISGGLIPSIVLSEENIKPENGKTKKELSLHFR